MRGNNVDTMEVKIKLLACDAPLLSRPGANLTSRRRTETRNVGRSTTSWVEEITNVVYETNMQRCISWYVLEYKSIQMPKELTDLDPLSDAATEERDNIFAIFVSTGLG